MIFTRIKFKNISCFHDTELDLSYPRKIKDSSIACEYLENAENFRFKRICILMGANASGKTSFGKILCSVLNILTRQNKISSFIEEYSIKGHAEIEVEFVIPNEMMFYTFSLYLPEKNQTDFDITAQCRFLLTGVPINKNDNVEGCREKTKNVLGASNKKNILIENLSEVIDEDTEAESLKKWRKLLISNNFSSSKWVFSFSDHSEQDDKVGMNFLSEDHLENYKKILCSTLKTFDPSISRLDHSSNSDGEVTTLSVHFAQNGQALINQKGDVIDNKTLFSMGTYQGIEVANFLYYLKMTKTTDSATFYLDEKMSYSHSRIEQAVLEAIKNRLNKYSQFFYTTHNLDVLDMNLPLHSYVFLSKKSGNPEFIWGNTISNKNDRGLRNYVLNNCFNTVPNTELLQNLWSD